MQCALEVMLLLLLLYVALFIVVKVTVSMSSKELSATNPASNTSSPSYLIYVCMPLQDEPDLYLCLDYLIKWCLQGRE